MIAKIFTAFALAFLLITCAHAQTVQIAVRCTVPAIPGVNAPLMEASGQGAAKGGSAYVSTGTERKETADGKKLVKTYYAR